MKQSETTPVTVPGEQRDCACGGNGKHYTFHSSESCGVEPKVEQRGDTPQPVDSNEVVTKRNQLEAQPLPAARPIPIITDVGDEQYEQQTASEYMDHLEAELSRLTSELSEAKAEHGKTLLLLSKAAFETIPELEAKLAHSKPAESNG